MRIAIIGCGKMGSGLAQRLSSQHDLFLYDRHEEKVEALRKHGKPCKALPEALESAEFVVLAIKPQALEKAVHEIPLKPNQVLISVLAGITLATLKKYFPKNKIIRMMPNLAVAHGDGLVALTSDKTEDQLTKALEDLGHIYWIPETKFDAFTALAASGPAFVFAMIEAMVEAGINMGFSAADAQKIVEQMIKGSLTLLEKTDKHPGELKWDISSPGGTTIAGLKKLEDQSLRSYIINIFLATYERAKQLNKL